MEEQMFEKKKTVVDVAVAPVVEVIPEPTVAMNDVALSLVKDAITGSFTVVKVNFDLATKTAGVVEVITTSPDRDGANQEFKINAVKLGLVR
jgi:hypothetical protein